MDSVLPIDQRSRHAAQTAAAIVFVVAVGAAVIQAGGFRSFGLLLRFYPPVTFAGSAGLLGLALGLLAVSRGDSAWALVGSGVAIIASVADGTAGLNSAASALSLVSSGIGIGALALRRWIRAGTIVGGVAGMVSAVVCAALLFTYTTDVLSGLRVSQLTATAIPVALAHCAAGVAIVALAWRREGDSAGPFPGWVPWAAGGAVLLTTVLLWRALTAEERDRAGGMLRTQATVAHHELLTQLQAAFQQLRQLGSGAGDSTTPAPAQNTPTVRRSVADVPALQQVAWIDTALSVRRVVTTGRGVAPDSVELERMLRQTGIGVRQAVMPDHPVVRVANDVAGRVWLLLAASQCEPVGCGPPVIGLLDPEVLLRPSMAIAVPGYHVAVRADGQLLYRSRGGSAESRWIGHIDRTAYGPRWEMQVWPTAGTTPLFQSDLPQVVGGLGLVVSALLTATLRLVQTGFAAARRAERARVALALETATDGLWELDLATGESTRSRAVWERLGYDPATVAGDSGAEQWTSLIHPEDRARVKQKMDEYIAGHAPDFEIEYRIQARDGNWHWMVERGRVVERDLRSRAIRLLGICADVTERKRADEALAASERRFRVVFDSGFQFESLLDLDGRLLESNRTSLEFAGVGLQDVRGKYYWETPWWRGSTASRMRLQHACHEAGRGKTVQYQDEVTGEGDNRALIDFSLKPIRDADGRVTQILAEGRDITERRRAEDAMREMDTLSTMGRVAARVAHEINNPLAGIENAFLLVKDAVAPSHPYFAYVGAIEREIGRIAAVTRQLYETYRPASEGMNEASVPLVLSDAVRMLEQVNRKSQVRIEVDAAGAPGVLPLPSALLRQAVYNLVQNAVEASPAGQVVSVRAWVEGQVFWLSVRDRGPGVPDELKEKIFEPFVTTRRNSKTAGMGLGLSLVRRSVQALGGRIEIHDGEGGGAEFRIRLTLPDHSRNGQ